MNPQEKTRLVLTAVVSAVITSVCWWKATDYVFAEKLSFAKSKGFTLGQNELIEQFRNGKVCYNLDHVAPEFITAQEYRRMESERPSAK